MAGRLPKTRPPSWRNWNSSARPVLRARPGALAAIPCRRRCRGSSIATNRPPVAEEALRRIAELYAIEAQTRDADAAVRLALRQQEALPRLSDLHSWLCAKRRVAADGTGLARAIDYSLKRWPAILRYVESGQLPIDNNPIENAIRPICLGRRNWLFVGSERAGQRAAAIQSLLATASLNGLEPYAWLRGTLEKLPLWPHSRIDELLPLGGRVIDVDATPEDVIDTRIIPR